jgi:hypothetical protein
VSADQRVNAAREYLTSVRRRKVGELPPSVLVRECAELRRLLGQVLDVVEDVEVTAQDEEVTAVTMWGGLHIAAADARTVLQALSDAAECAEDEHFPASPTEETAARYRELIARIGGQE